MIHYPIPPHLQPAYAESAMLAGSLPLAEAISSEILSLPIGPHMSSEQIERVVTCIAELKEDSR